MISELIVPSPTDVSPDPMPIAESAPMREAVRAALEVAPTPVSVLLLGEAGTGRSRLARLLHLRSGRRGACIEVRCGPGQAPAAPPAELLAAAAGGTLVLHDVDALSPPGQAILLRTLQERDPHGAGAARVIATDCADLPERAAAGAYRSDLFYRLNVFPISVPALRDRAEDLLPLATDLLVEAAAAAGRPTLVLSRAATAALQGRALPGNVPELRDVIRRAVARSRGGAIEAADLFEELSAAAPATFPAFLPLDLVELERIAIAEALRRVNGNRTQAARILNIGLRTLRNKLRAWRDAGEEVPPSPHGRQDAPASPRPGAGETAAILARSWARRSQIERA